jgi:hypothetical protein
MSLAHRGVPLSEEHKKHIALAGIGRRHSEESKRKLSEAWTVERIEKLRERLRTDGNPAKLEIVRAKIRAAKLGKPRPDVASYLGGDRSPSKRPDVKKKMSLAKLGRVWVVSPDGVSRLVSLSRASQLQSLGWIHGRELKKGVR